MTRNAADLRAHLLAFLQSAYEAGVGAAGWEADDLASSALHAPFVPFAYELVSL